MNLEQQIKDDIKNNSVILYLKGTKSMPMCGFSSTVVNILNAYDIEWMEWVTRNYGREVVADPTFIILGATTLNGFKKVFSGSESENGFLQRFLPVVAIHQKKKRMMFLERQEIDISYIEKMELKIKKIGLVNS